jgi:hypothetical protein
MQAWAKTKTTVYLDEDVLRGAKVMAARTGKKDYEIVEQALRAYLGHGGTRACMGVPPT